MNWSESDTDRLYEFYEQHFQELRAAVVSANRSHGSTQPEKTWMTMLSRDEFEQLLTNPDEPQVIERWLRRIVRGHEHEFPNLKVA